MSLTGMYLVHKNIVIVRHDPRHINIHIYISYEGASPRRAEARLRLRACRNGRGCRQIEGVKCDSIAKGCIKKLPSLSQVEQRERQSRPYTLHPTELQYSWGESTRRLHDARSASVFAPCPYYLLFGLSLFVCGGSALAAIITAASCGSLNPTYLP